jgi:hypothetical protein
MSTVNVKAMNRAFLDQIESGDHGQVKQAQDNASKFTRMQMRETGFYRQIQPMETITDDMLSKRVDTDLPVFIGEREPGSPGSVTLPFASLPSARYIRGNRFEVWFARMMTPKLMKDVAELRTYDMDIRQVMSDNIIKDMLAEEDSKYIASVNLILGGAAGATVTETGSIHWKAITGGLNRTNWVECKKILPSLPSKMETAKALLNNLTIKDLEKWQYDERGGDQTQEIAVKGFTHSTLHGVDLISTIKHDLVPTNRVYFFAEPKALGRSFEMEPASMYIDKKHFMIEFFVSQIIGGTISNVAGVAAATLSATYNT